MVVKRKSVEDFSVDIFSYLILIFMGIATLLPFLNVLSKAVSADWAVVSGKVGIFPVGFQLDTLKFVVTSPQFLNSFLVSVFVTVVGTVIAILMTCVAAYPVSKKHLKGMKGILLLYVFTMLFSGGMIPHYLLIRQLGLINNLFSLILPGMISVFNMLVMKSYYENLPECLEESARIDGASNMVVLFRIVLPLSMPVIATISLFYAVGFWNEFFSALLYINDPKLKPLQLYLRDIVLESNNTAAGLEAKTMDDLMNVTPDGIRAATIIASTVPILCVYPYLQKYFIKGMLIGSVKG